MKSKFFQKVYRCERAYSLWSKSLCDKITLKFKSCWANNFCL